MSVQTHFGFDPKNDPISDDPSPRKHSCTKGQTDVRRFTGEEWSWARNGPGLHSCQVFRQDLLHVTADLHNTVVAPNLKQCNA